MAVKIPFQLRKKMTSKLIKKFVVSSFLLSAFGSLSPIPAMAATPFKVVALNIWNGGSHMVGPNAQNGALLAMTVLPGLFKDISGQTPALFALQEVESRTPHASFNEVESMLANLPGWSGFFGSAMKDYHGYSGEYGNAFLTNTTIVKGPWNYKFAFGDTSDCLKEKDSGKSELEIWKACAFGAYPRQILANKVAFVGGNKLWFVSTHLDQIEGVAYKQQVFELLGFVKTMDPVFPIIIAGDMNVDAEAQKEFEGIMNSAGFICIGRRDREQVYLYDYLNKIEVLGKSYIDKNTDRISNISDHEGLIIDLQWK